MGKDCQMALLCVGVSDQGYLSGSGAHEQADWRKRRGHCKYSVYGRYRNTNKYTLTEKQGWRHKLKGFYLHFVFIFHERVHLLFQI